MRHILLIAGAAGLLYAGLALAEVDVNTAGTGELTELSGIGPAKAAAIRDYRQENGDFESVDGLANVSGIGPKTVDSLRDEATVGDES